MKIAKLWVYPIKSLQGIALNDMCFDELGPVADRRYMLVDEQGSFFSQRQSALLSQIKVEQAGDTLQDGFHVFVPNQQQGHDTYYEPLFLDFLGQTDVKNLINVAIWSDSLNVYWQQHALEKLISLFIGQPLRLVYISGIDEMNDQRRVNEQYTRSKQLVGFADGFPSLICTQASFNALSQKIQRLAQDTPVNFSIERYRPNILVDIEDNELGEKYTAFAEDNWQAVENENVRFELVKPCSRCVIPTIEPSSAKKQSIVWNALKALNSRDGELYFGQNAMHTFFNKKSCIKVNDRLNVIS